MNRALPWIALTSIALATSAFAQDDDDLAPVVKKPKPAPVAKPKPKPAPKPVAKPKVEEDDLAPVVSKGDLQLKLPQQLSNAMVSIDGRDIGLFPVGVQSLPPGEHQVKIHRPGYADFTKKVTIVAGKTAELEAKLTATHALVSIASDVADAQVFINGKSVGTVPLKDVEVPPGPAEVVIRKEGFKEDKRSLTLVAGKDATLSVKLAAAGPSTVIAAVDRPVETKLTPAETVTPLDTQVTKATEDTPIYGRWYFWAGVAAVAVGATIGTTVVLANNQPSQRLDEKTVCAVNGGHCDLCIGLQCAGAFRFPLTGR